jgi:hypothetical protein
MPLLCGNKTPTNIYHEMAKTFDRAAGRAAESKAAPELQLFLIWLESIRSNKAKMSSNGGHIRPKVRKTKGPSPTKQAGGAAVLDSPVHNTQQNKKSVDEILVKMEHWMGLDQKNVAQNNSENPINNSSAICVPEEQTFEGEDNKELKNARIPGANSTGLSSNKPEAPKSILKKPKYSSASPAQSPPAQQESAPLAAKKPSVFKQNQILERNPGQMKMEREARQLNNSIGQGVTNLKDSAVAVEGYEPQFDHNKRIQKGKPKADDVMGEEEVKSDDNNKNKSQEPLIFGSLADIMEAAGTLPPQDPSGEPQLVEADLSFSCLSPEEYRRRLEEMSQLESKEELENNNNGDRKPEWKQKNPSPYGSMLDEPAGECYMGNDPSLSDEENDDSEGGGGGFFDLLGGEGCDEESISEVAPPRSFRILWECLSPLITHESCYFLRKLKQEHEIAGSSGNLITTTHADDLSASRSAGFMAMLRMYISRSLKELGQPVDMRRTAEQRLTGLLHTFNFNRPAGKLDTSQWKALTCILLEMVLFLDTTNGEASKLPASVQAVGMTVEEYRYLIKNTIGTLDIPDPVT